MAQLKDLLVSGPSRLIGKLFANEAQLTTLNIPTTSGGTIYGPGTNNQVLTSNGTTVYWASGFSGNASTADKLKTARQINGTNFDGSANITTANWGTARNISIGNSDGTGAGTAVSVNGSAAVTLKLPATIKASLTGNADTTTAANITTTANAVAYYTNTTGTFGSKASANGALYATSANGALQWGTLPAAQGGTGKTTLKDACNALINALDTGSSNLTANDYVITQYVGGGTTTTTYHRRPASAIRVGGLLTARKLKVALGSTTDVTFDGTADQTSIPVSGTLGLANGGTGATTAANARTNLGLGTIATYDAATAGTKDTWGKVPVIGASDGVLEVGKYIDFHTTDGNTADYDVRITAATTGLTISGTTTGTFSGSLTGNASTATKFASAQSVALTGDVTGSASSQAGWSIATTLANSGVTAASYGPSANASPSHGGTFTVPYLTVDAKGRVTAASTKTITLPADSNTDTKVTQTNTTGSADYRILFSGNANDTNETTTVRKNTNLKYNPSTKNLQLTSGILTLGTSHINQATTTGTATAAADSGASASPNRYKPALWKFNYGIVPVTGDTIVIKTPGVGHDYGTWLSLDNGTTYHPICTWQGTSHSRVTTHFPSGSYLYLVYDANQVTDSVFAAAGSDSRSNVTGSWCVVNFYDSNTTRVWELYKCYGNYTANNIIKRYQILFQGLRPNEKKLIALYETDNNTATGKTLLTSTEFDPLGEIFYYNSTGAYAAGNTIDAGRLNYTALADLRYTFNITNDTSVAETTAFRGTAPNPLYLRVTINSATGGAKVDTNQPLTTALPTTADGKYYIYLGNVYDWYRVYLNRDHPVYFHNGTRLTEYKGHTTTTNSLVLSGSTNATMTAASTNPKITFMENANTQPVHLIYTDQDSYRSPAGLKIIGGTSATPAWLEVEGNYYATGTSTGQGYQVLGNGVEYGRWWLNTIGEAGTATTYTNPDDSSQTKTGYTGNVTGNIYLSIGNNKAVGSNGSSYASPGTAGTANNAQGYLRLYSSGTAYGEMTGYGNYIYPTKGIAFPENKVALNFRPSSSSYYTHFSHQTSGNEALVMATQNAVTSFIFVNGESLSNIASDRWTKLTGASGAGNAPGLQIKNNCVSIGKLIPNGTTPTYKLEVNGTGYFADDITALGGMELKGHITGDASTTTGHGLYSGGGYHNAYNNLILHGDASTGSSGIAFISDKVTAGTGAITNVNAPSDRAFIQYHACGITTATAENTNPTLATSGEAGRLVIGIGNDATDQVWLQTPGRTGLIHQVAAASYVIPDTGNTTGTVGGSTQPVYVDGGVIKACTAYVNASVNHAETADSATSAGSATTASKLGSADVGSATQPIYLDDGTPKAATAYSGLLTAFSLSTNTLSLTVGGTTKTASAVSSVANAWTGGTSAGPTLKVTVNGVAATAAAIPSASASASGIITNAAQTIAGAKTLSNMLTIKGLKGTSNTDYGTALPSSGTEGQIFFQISDETYEIPAGGTTGQALIKNSNTDRDVKWGPVGGQQTPNNSTKFYPSGSTSTSANTGDAVFNTSVYVQNSVLFGAAWNDYAEYRETTTPVEAGRVVVENGDDTLSLSTERMQPGAEIVSDTFGFAIGQTEKSKTAIAASGRVLAYPHEPRRTYRPGQPVCSGPNGTVSQMTDEEARMYPWCIIGTVSSIPEYDTWGEENIQVNGRIWIRIR